MKELHSSQLKEKDNATFFSPTEVWCFPAPSAIKPEEIEFVVDSGASMHAEQERPELSRVGNRKSLEKTRPPLLQPMQTKDEATVFVKDLDLFVTAKLLEDTPAVLSLGKLCEDHGYNDHRTSGQKPLLIKHGDEYNASRKTTYRSLSLVYRQAL